MGIYTKKSNTTQSVSIKSTFTVYVLS